ncbi:sarcoplasmic/endoplasmic reticulum calcium ATPase regulator DWORF isoform X1 [Balaenoptera acutorostrata]|uniref:Sarcoplasmic/endoplasmic reticulum calcium ATPase regulator DWORF isoform X1 n=1 Tax=Balaenoptera acutorostrata TaxID=9767 RepID=A0A452CAT7_BALAC|nr:sarcoplasmic/endoplasmic reticulum calcium ATPase regulator DWORF isoform X1 [Balaenoptera acutorostrata]
MLSEDGIKKAERFGPMGCPASWTGNRKVLYSPCRVQVLLAQKAKVTGLLYHHSLDLLKSPFLPGAPLKAGSICITWYRDWSSVPRCGVCCRQSLNALSSLLQGRRIKKERSSAFQCLTSPRQLAARSQAAATLFRCLFKVQRDAG